MADVFISYAREDGARAEQIARALGAMGLDVFWDTEIPPGKTWADYIEEKLSQSKAMIVLWSAHSTNSQWVREEARMGRDSGKLIPAMLDGTLAPFGFGEVQSANLSAWNGAPNHPDFVRFANAVDAKVRGPNATPRPIPAAAPQSFAATISSGADEQLSPPGYILKCLRKYFDGNGRARRLEYWMFGLFQFIAWVVAMIIDISLFGINAEGVANVQLFFSIVLFGLAAPSVTVTIRRFHDVGLSGWWLLAAYPGIFLFGLGALAILIVALIPGKPVENKYGPPPKSA
ncbi:MAG: DUF805 domain-containing protein [Hyphomonadaceae bacterium]|nr:DUF805 domain-containing protein [Hyphomonadaceae bacterium]